MSVRRLGTTTPATVIRWTRSPRATVPILSVPAALERVFRQESAPAPSPIAAIATIIRRSGRLFFFSRDQFFIKVALMVEVLHQGLEQVEIGRVELRPCVEQVVQGGDQVEVRDLAPAVLL